MKSTISSPVTVLMSWCRLKTLTPVTAWTIASMTGRASSISWVRTCLSRSLPSRGERLDQLLFGGGQHAVKANHEQITDQVGLDILGATAHVFLLKTRDPLADRGFDFSLRFHRKLRTCPHHIALQMASVGQSFDVTTKQRDRSSSQAICRTLYQSRKKNHKLIAFR